MDERDNFNLTINIATYNIKVYRHFMLIKST